MMKRIAFAVIGGAMGALIGVLIHGLGAGDWAVLACGAAGAAVPAVLGRPGR